MISDESNYLQDPGRFSNEKILEDQLADFKDKIAEIERELERRRIGELVVGLLNQSDEASTLASQIGGSFVFWLLWDAEAKKFLPAEIPTASESQWPMKSTGAVGEKPRSRKTWDPLGQAPPQEQDYYIPILQALRQLGWAATPRQITPLVLERMRSRLAEDDFDSIPSGQFARWEVRLRFARKRMRDESTPLLNPNSARGIWEATEAGRRFLEGKEGDRS
ncbi:MAG: winged helix-turn-helix domain-containing protein [Chloroflexi bacterium]|nr:winged helix-turn-helix domain-containing protein [Chloroflexota bacterium]